MAKTINERINSFTDVCAIMKMKEQDYAVPANATLDEEAAILHRMLKLIGKAFRGKRKIRMADTDQWKHYPFFRIIPDVDAPGGFRLSFVGSVCGSGYACLGVRPYFLESGESDHAGETFLPIYERLMQIEELLEQQDL
jgi:hypothetical protein